MPAGFLYLVQYAYVERAHRDFLRSVLLSQGATLPTTNPGGYTANFGSSLRSILETIYVVEETGVRAYLGAAGFMNNLALAQTAVAIHSTEARHSAALRGVLGLPFTNVLDFLTGDRNVRTGTIGANPDGLSQDTLQYFQLPTQILAAIQQFNAPSQS